MGGSCWDAPLAVGTDAPATPVRVGALLLEMQKRDNGSLVGAGCVCAPEGRGGLWVVPEKGDGLWVVPED